MRISKLLMPAVTLAGALALAGCGGGSDGTGMGERDTGNGCDAPNIKDGDDCLTPAEYRAKIAKEVEEENKKTDAAKEKVADASALYDRLVTAITAIGADQIFTYAAAAAANGVLSTVKDEHKGIETLYRDGQTWLRAIDESDTSNGTSAAIGDRIGPEVTSGENAGYYPIATDVNHSVKAAAFTQRVGLEHKEGASFSGEYMGVPGTFKCTGSDGCTSSPAADGTFDLPPSQWHFKPNDRMARLQGSRAAVWGWWMAGTGDKAGTEEIRLRYAVRNAADTGSAAVRASDGAAFPAAGEATYTGKALGQYAVVDGADSESGAFEATASLTAKFRGDAGAETNLSGRVHDFDVNSDWEITLKEEVHASGTFDGKTVWKTGGEDGLGEGDWRATLHGGAATEEPTHVVGGFTAVDAGARMIGAFGGEPPKQE